MDKQIQILALIAETTKELLEADVGAVPSDKASCRPGLAEADPTFSARWNFFPIGASNGAPLTSDGLSI
jgi:hypothetical protein